ncbi:hypothetical protein Avbf_15015 [Armadillidium vulgare]|nr:hypothetical protein Avbf_15015 [Armadillidium vulgare]
MIYNYELLQSYPSFPTYAIGGRPPLDREGSITSLCGSPRWSSQPVVHPDWQTSSSRSRRFSWSFIAIPVEGQEDKFVVGLKHDLVLVEWGPNDPDYKKCKSAKIHSFDDIIPKCINDANVTHLAGFGVYLSKACQVGHILRHLMHFWDDVHQRNEFLLICTSYNQDHLVPILQGLNRASDQRRICPPVLLLE